jgi:diguanylate cyclase (GGDEF)-like protein/PAS domain S-box-containing protein
MRDDTSTPERQPAAPLAVAGTIAILYAVAGGLWIWFSDSLALRLVDDPVLLTRFQTYKGWGFVGATALLLFLMLLYYASEQARALRAMRLSTEHFRALAEATSDWTWEVDANGVYAYVSPKVRDLLGYEPQELIGRTPFELMPPEEAARSRGDFEAAVASRSPLHQIENLNRRRDGQLVVLETSGIPVLDEAGQLVGYRGIDREITARKRNEVALRRAHAILAAASFAAEQFLKAPAWEKSMQAVLSRLGDAAEVSRVYMFENLPEFGDEAVSRQRFEWTAPGVQSFLDDPRLREFHWEREGFGDWVARLRRGEEVAGHARGQPPAVAAFLAEESIASIAVVPIHVDGVWLGIVGINQCVAEREWSRAELDALRLAANTIGAAIRRERTDHALRERETRLSQLAAVVEQAGESIIIADLSGKITYVNPHFERASGYSAAEAVGENPRILKSGRQDAAFYTNLWDTITSGRVWAGQLINRRKDGTLHHEEATIVPVRSAGGQIINYAAIKRDVTERVLAERRIASLTRLYAVLSHTNAAIIRARDQHTLFNAVCRVAVEHGGFVFAWVGMIDAASGRLARAAHAGDGATEIPGIVDSIGNVFEGDGPTATAVRERRVAYVSDFEARPRITPWHEVRAGRGYRGSATLPLHREGRVVAVLKLYVAEPEFFVPEQIRLLEEMAADISFCLDAIGHEEKRRVSEQELRKLSSAVEQSANMVFISDTRGVIEYVNPRFTAVTGFTPEEAIGRSARMLWSEEMPKAAYEEIMSTVRAGDEWHGEVRNRRKDGVLHWCLLSVAPVRSENRGITHCVAVAEDVSERKSAQSLIERMAFYDALTDLPNRRLFGDRLGQAIASARRTEKLVALLYIDFDRFKNVNDTLGHAAGDDLLRQAAARLRNAVRGVDTVARFGGDEFIILLPGLAKAQDAAGIAQKVLDALAAPFDIVGHLIYTAASIGITLYPIGGDEADTLLRSADMAMYSAKEAGNAYRFFTPELEAASHERLVLENGMREGLEHGRFLVYYQPQFDLASGRVTGVEALVRWQWGEELVSPARFIPVAEDTGLIIAIGAFVLKAACRDARTWEKQGLPALRVGVNLSARQFQDVVPMVTQALEESGLDPRRLELEITERLVMKNAEEAAAILTRLKGLGIGISIDDFGTGYSSLSYLKRFPIDGLKIDQSFVRDMAVDDNDKAIVAAIIAMAHSLGIRTVAEGVETADQLRLLRGLSCDEGQGYHFARPMPAAQFVDWLREYGEGGGPAVA